MSTFSRRVFLKTSAGVAALAALPTIIPSSALGKDGATPPSDRFHLGAIGVGGRGMAVLGGLLGQHKVRCVSVCDVSKDAQNNAKNRVDGRNKDKECKVYGDFREMLDKEDLDAVCHALPDHWHAVPTILCAQKGLAVYGEKPFARTIREGRAMVNAIDTYGTVWQTGSQQRSNRRFRHVSELVLNGHIGKVKRVEVGLPGGIGYGWARAKKLPKDDLDWAMWVGPAPWRDKCDFGGKNNPTNPQLDWRWVLDYSGGMLTDWMGHHIDIALWAMGLSQTGPTKIVPHSCTFPKTGPWNVMSAYNFTLHFPGGIEINVSNTNRRGVKFFGEKDQWLHVRRGYTGASTPGLLHETISPSEIRLPQSRSHSEDFVKAARRGRHGVAPPEDAHRAASAGLLGEIALRVNRTIQWDPATEMIANDNEASRLLGRAYRAPWTL